MAAKQSAADTANAETQAEGCTVSKPTEVVEGPASTEESKASETSQRSTVDVVIDPPEAADGLSVALLSGWRKPRDKPTLEEVSAWVPGQS